MTIPEYFSASFTIFMTTSSIIHQSSCLHSPQQNGIAERMKGHLLEVVRILFYMNVPIVYLTAILIACYLINRIPSSVLNGKSTFLFISPRPLFPLPPCIFGSYLFCSLVCIQCRQVRSSCYQMSILRLFLYSERISVL